MADHIIQLTQEHIDKGRTGTRSPVMLALRDAYPGKEVYRVAGTDMITIHAPDGPGLPHDEGHYLEFSWFVEDWLSRHRRGEQLRPITLVVRYGGDISNNTVYTQQELIALDNANRDRDCAIQAEANRQQALAARPWWKKLLGLPP